MDEEAEAGVGEPLGVRVFVRSRGLLRSLFEGGGLGVLGGVGEGGGGDVGVGKTAAGVQAVNRTKGNRIRVRKRSDFTSSSQGALHPFERFSQEGARASKIQPHEVLSAGAKFGAVIQGNSGPVEDTVAHMLELIRARMPSDDLK